MACCTFLKSDEVLVMRDLILPLGLEIWALISAGRLSDFREIFIIYKLERREMEPVFSFEDQDKFHKAFPYPETWIL